MCSQHEKELSSPPPHFLFPSLLPPPLLPSPPIMAHCHAERFLSGRSDTSERQAASVRRRGPWRRTPRQGGQPPVNRLALLKPDRPRIKALESDLRTWPEALQLIAARKTSEAPVHLFVDYSANLPSQRRGHSETRQDLSGAAELFQNW